MMILYFGVFFRELTSARVRKAKSTMPSRAGAPSFMLEEFV